MSANDHLGAAEPDQVARHTADWNRLHHRPGYPVPQCLTCLDSIGSKLSGQEVGMFFDSVNRQWAKCPNCYGKSKDQ